MATTLKLTKKQEEMLYLLRLDGLRREIELHEATEAYNKNEYYSEDGERITNGDCDYLIYNVSRIL